MNRYDFVCEWFNASPYRIKKYTLKDAAEDMQNLRTEIKNDPEYTLPIGLSARFLYETVNELIKKQLMEE